MKNMRTMFLLVTWSTMVLLFAEAFATAEGSVPHFRVNPSRASVHIWGHEWPTNATIMVVIGNDPDNPDFEKSSPVDPSGDWDIHDDTYAVKAGDRITVSDGSTTIDSYIVTALTITEVNPTNDTVSGTADQGCLVVVHVYNAGSPLGRNVETDEHGNWLADFSVAGGDNDWNRVFDIQQGHHGAACQCDDQSEPFGSTQIDWRIDRPFFLVDSVGNSVWGHEWPAGESVTVTIGDPEEPDFTSDPVAVNEWGDWHLWVWEELYDIQSGELITVASGDIVKEHIVTELVITYVDPEADTVSGAADPHTWVDVHVHWEHVGRYVQADGNGDWIADFSSAAGDDHWERAFDIEPGTAGAATQWDDDGDGTHLQWIAERSRPIIRVEPESWNFGHVLLGAAVTQVFDVVNIGKLDLVIGEVLIINGSDVGHFAIEQDDCSYQTIAPGGVDSRTITVSFAPTNAWGKSVVLRFPVDDEDDPFHDVRIYGTGRSESDAEERFEEGLAALADFMSEFGNTTDLLEANDKFGEALAADPDHYGAAIFRLLTSIFALPYDDDIAQMLTDFGTPEEGRELWEWTAEFPEVLPEGVPFLDEVVHLAAAKLEEIIEEGLGNLGRIPVDWAGSVIFSPEHLPIDNEVQVDAGDVQMFQAALSLLQGVMGMVRAHDWHIAFEDLDDGELQLSDHLANYPTLGALTNAALFAEAAGWFVEAIDFYQVGSELIRNETDYQHDDLIVFDPDSLDDERLFRNVLSQIRNSLTGTTATPFEIELSQVLDLDHVFHNPSSMRDLVGGAGLQGALGSVFLHQIDRALANLDEVDDAFAQTLTPEVDPVDQDVEMDHGDIWMARAWLNTWKSLIHTAQAYDLNDIDMVAWAERDPFLMSDVFDDPGTPDLFTVTDEAAFVAASNAFQAAMNAYLSGSEFLRSHAGTRSNDVFAIWANEFLMGGDRVTHDEAAFRALLEDLQVSMAEPVLIDYKNRKKEHAFFEIMHLGRFFTAPYVTRAHAPEFDTENRALSGTFPDPTLNAIFPELSQWHMADRLGLELMDSGGLGLPDLWQLHYFDVLGQNPSAITPSGMTYEEAFRARTDPTDPGCFLGLTDTFSPVPGDSVVEIRWQSMPYLYYAVESVTNLLSDEWHLERIAPATPYINVFTDDSEDANRKFYRIRLYD